MKKEITHNWFVDEHCDIRYACNTACGVTESKLCDKFEMPTCKNCLKKFLYGMGGAE